MTTSLNLSKGEPITAVSIIIPPRVIASLSRGVHIGLRRPEHQPCQHGLARQSNRNRPCDLHKAIPAKTEGLTLQNGLVFYNNCGGLYFMTAAAAEWMLIPMTGASRSPMIGTKEPCYYKTILSTSYGGPYQAGHQMLDRVGILGFVTNFAGDLCSVEPERRTNARSGLHRTSQTRYFKSTKMQRGSRS